MDWHKPVFVFNIVTIDSWLTFELLYFNIIFGSHEQPAATKLQVLDKHRIEYISQNLKFTKQWTVLSLGPANDFYSAAYLFNSINLICLWASVTIQAYHPRI